MFSTGELFYYAFIRLIILSFYVNVTACCTGHSNTMYPLNWKLSEWTMRNAWVQGQSWRGNPEEYAVPECSIGEIHCTQAEMRCIGRETTLDYSWCWIRHGWYQVHYFVLILAWQLLILMCVRSLARELVTMLSQPSCTSRIPTQLRNPRQATTNHHHHRGARTSLNPLHLPELHNPWMQVTRSPRQYISGWQQTKVCSPRYSSNNVH